MPKTKNQKNEVVKDLTENLKKSKMVVLTDFKGLKVKDVTELRRELSNNKSACQVVKKTMMNLAFKEAGINYDASDLPGNIIGLSFDYDESLAPVKIVAGFGKTHDKMAILGGIYQNAFLTAAEVKTLATLPNREQLLGQLLGTMKGPITGFVTVISGNMRGLLQVLNARRESLEKVTA